MALFLPTTPSAIFYKHLRLLSAPLCAAIEPSSQKGRPHHCLLRLAFAPESVIWLSQITPADTRYSPCRPRTEFSGRTALLIVRPETVIKWHRQGFRLYWRWKSRCRKPGLHAGRKPDWMSKIAQRLPDRGPDGSFRHGRGLAEAPSAGTIMVKHPRWSRARGHTGNPDSMA
jgi:hypothetical protein